MRYIALVANPVLHFAIAMLLVFVTMRRYGSRHLLLLLNIFFLLIAESLITGGLNFDVFAGQQWNWTGKLTFFIFAVVIITRAKLLSISATGWARHLKRDSIKPIVLVSIVLLLLRLLIRVFQHRHFTFNIETIAFEATLPGLAEEALYRGLLLGLFNKLYFVKHSGESAILSWPLMLVSLLFGLAHGIRLDEQMHLICNVQVLCMIFGLGLILGWLRQCSGSLWPAVVFHNLWNVIVLA